MEHWFDYWTCILSIDSLACSVCKYIVSILAWQQILMLYFVFFMWSFLFFFRPEGLVHHCWSEFLKHNLVFTFEHSFPNDKCYYFSLYLFTFSFLFQFLMLEGIMVPISVALMPPSNEIYYVHWWIVGNNKSISSIIIIL